MASLSLRPIIVAAAVLAVTAPAPAFAHHENRSRTEQRFSDSLRSGMGWIGTRVGRSPRAGRATRGMYDFGVNYDHFARGPLRDWSRRIIAPRLNRRCASTSSTAHTTPAYCGR